MRRVSSANSFQFTPLREGRRHTMAQAEFDEKISIHAPPRGATSRKFTARKLTCHFNSRPSARGDLHRRAGRHERRYFNSRPSARGDCRACRTARTRFNFNSRPSARGDEVDGVYVNTKELISIHAPPRGATPETGMASTTAAFQFTPLREGRRVC